MEGLVKKLVITSMVASLLLAAGAAFGQTVTAATSHDVSIAIPEVVMIRLTNGTSNGAVTSNLDIGFEITEEDLVDLTVGVDESFEPTSVNDWDDVRVFSNRASTWTVTLGVEPDEDSASFAWERVQVSPTGSGLRTTPFDLGSSSSPLVTSALRGWRSLGFGPENFALMLDGDVTEGDYSATVTYTLSAP